jgi:hypothetical protein
MRITSGDSEESYIVSISPIENKMENSPFKIKLVKTEDRMYSPWHTEVTRHSAPFRHAVFYKHKCETVHVSLCDGVVSIYPADVPGIATTIDNVKLAYTLLREDQVLFALEVINKEGKSEFYQVVPDDSKTENEIVNNVNMENSPFRIKLTPATTQDKVNLGTNGNQPLLRADLTPKDCLDEFGKNSVNSSVVHGNAWSPIRMSIDQNGLFSIYQYGRPDNATTIEGVYSLYVYETDGIARMVDIRTHGNKMSSLYRVLTEDIPAPIDLSMFPAERVVKPTECPLCFEENDSRTLLVCKGPVYHLGYCNECVISHPDQSTLCPTCGAHGTMLADYVKSGRPLPKKGFVRIA